MDDLLSSLHAAPATQRLVAAVLEAMPDHSAYLQKSFRNRSESTVALTERTAALVARIEGGGVDRLVAGYRWICGMIAEEELHFRRTGRYRHSSFAEVDAAVYQNRSQMGTYMDGLLATEILWEQHARTMDFYANTFLPKLTPGYRHLEVGPGHGILAYYAAIDPRCESLAGWDISPASLDQTASCLRALGVTRPVELRARNIMEEPSERETYDSIVISEVLEHLENPLGAMRNLRGRISGRGRIYVNVPVNAPTIDHLHLYSTPEEAVAMVETAGFIVDEVLYAPAGGYTLARARKVQGSISVAIMARPAA